ncbi:MAG: hypothetical protein KAH99_01655 [Verrucomicrobia bacterium]|nr:hypothetical protein [Verrucomicrobiota bacterium]
MNRSNCIALMMVAGLGFGSVLNVAGGEQSAELVADADKAVAVAENAVEEARVAIKNGKQFVAMIPEDSPLMEDVAEVLRSAKENWVSAVSALEGAKESASKISSASSPEIAQDYKLLATVNAGVALSGAKVVQTGLLFVDAVANNKSESLDIIKQAMQNSLTAAAQVQFNYERVKSIIAEKYSK